MSMLDAMDVAASGMQVQGERMRVVAENLANANSTADHPDDQPYRRKIVTFDNALNEETGMHNVQVDEIRRDQSDFERVHQPGHPAADDDGYVLKPNVNSVIELNDMRQAQRSHSANMNVIEASKSMLMKTIGLLR